MSYSIQIKTNAIELRKKGFSLSEIAKRLHISKSTISEWVSSIELSASAQKRLADKKIIGQYKSVLLKRELAVKKRKIAQELASKEISKIAFSKELLKLCCALLWWCEGNKDTTMVRFTSSDKTLISKFRALVHIHAYHDDETQKKYWSQITKIPLSQFNASFKKKNTGIRTKIGYPGCVAISYYDAKIAKELEAIYNAFTVNRGVR